MVSKFSTYMQASQKNKKFDIAMRFVVMRKGREEAFSAI